MSFQLEIQSLREKIINRIIGTTLLFVGIVLIPSLLRIIEFGFQPAMAIHLALTVLLGILYIIKNKIPLNLKAHIFLLLLFITPIAGLYNFRLAGASYIIIIELVIALLIYGKRVGLIYAISFMILFVTLAFLHSNNIINSTIDYNQYTNSKATWAANIMGIAFSIIVLIDISSMYYKLFMNTLKDSLNMTEELKDKNNQLRIAEKRYRSLFEGSVDGIILVDRNYNITGCNQSYLDLVGYESQELIGKRYNYGLPDNNTNWDEYFTQLALLKGNQKTIEIETRHKEGYYIPVEATPHMIENDTKVFLWGVVRDLRKIKQLEKQVFSNMVKAEEKERERYAKDLHDGLGPLLSTALIYLNTIKDEEDKENIKKYAQRAYEILKEGVGVVKEISNNLSPVILSEYGIVHAVRSFIEKAKQATAIKFILSDKTSIRYPELVEITLYRIIVELINNSIKYSNAQHVTIAFECQQGKHLISYNDDGVGFDYQSAIAENGFGLVNMENRIKKIGGRYQYNTSPGMGVKVNIELKETCT